MDRLLSMRVFVQVIDEGGFAAAARALDMSPAGDQHRGGEIDLEVQFAHEGGRLDACRQIGMAQRLLQARARIDAESLQRVERVEPNLRVDVREQGDDIRLRELGVHYAFATGYSDELDVPIEHRSVPIVVKPYTSESLSRVFVKQ